jgi:hypothetical protein
MRRREFIALVGSGAVAWPLAAFGKAQRIALVLPSQPVTVVAETNDEPFCKRFLTNCVAWDIPRGRAF